MRYFIELAYNGKNYHGWQAQPNAITVQEVVEKALSTLIRETVKVVGCGRTDTGVHAKQYYLHFETEREFDSFELCRKLNSFLPNDVAIYHIFPVTAEAHARFDAIARTYEYLITLKKDPFLTDTAYQHNRSLDIDRLNKASALLLNYTDFKCFSRSNTDVKTYNCKITKAVWRKQDNMLIFTITADRFLRNMVRAIVGTLLPIGLGDMDVKNMIDVIESKDRKQAGASAPGHALYLSKIEYPSSIKLL
ncbi:tRNA pseudouridine(38-40) synthase TruA [Spongiivirga sp. MCCC 1A20706]|uniref:tRNA pseudouridine(38-40) synthase TruA n=1 Tax=Spongiivirga sp. MCCC 1A20706 TaxID=3160963 RepID=UPI0039772EEC